MKSKKQLFSIISLIITFLLIGCASAPTHLIIAPEIITPPISKQINQQASLNIIDMRTANHIVQILRENEAATIFSAQERLEDIIKNSLSKHWPQQGLVISNNSVNAINIDIENALINVKQDTFKYQVQTEIVLKVSINNGIKTLTSTFKNTGSSKGPFKADLAVLERNFNQRLSNLLQNILVNEEINQFLR